jgi:hypothetical protein
MLVNHSNARCFSFVEANLPNKFRMHCFFFGALDATTAVVKTTKSDAGLPLQCTLFCSREDNKFQMMYAALFFFRPLKALMAFVEPIVRIIVGC